MKIDLITGLLGAGKTSFLKYYAAYLLSQGEKIGIIENDFGAVNIDMMLLQELQDRCEIEMIAGGDRASYLRRFKTKLIAMKMRGLDRIIVEPSGLFDVDEFFDLLHDEPLNQWYELNSIIALIDGQALSSLDTDLKEIFISQLLPAGQIIVTRKEKNDREVICDKINSWLLPYHYQLSAKELLCLDVHDLTDLQLQQLSQCGYQLRGIMRRQHPVFDQYETLYIMDKSYPLSDMIQRIKEMMDNQNCGKIRRIKGFVNDGGWIEINATPQQIHTNTVTKGQKVLIIIGEKLNKEKIMTYFQ
ncbi:GTPase (G3E family) [[Clostridium] spiroforme]|nr:GTPase (G3E family) [Thomasclavelia spiroformis]MBM6931572.1 GTPase (G3E family) [Thomasclavelia spiroformis]